MIYMNDDLLLILDDDNERLIHFKQISGQLAKNISVVTWMDAPTMLAEVDGYLAKTKLISLDHDLYKQKPSDPETGCGRDVADYLATCSPVCPVIIHSSNIDAAWGMYNVLSFAGWQVEVVPHTGRQVDWYDKTWLVAAKQYF